MDWSSLCVRTLIRILFFSLFPPFATSQSPPEPPQGWLVPDNDLASLIPDPSRRTELQKSLVEKDYKQAEAILVGEANLNRQSNRAGKLLAFAGGVFFLDGSYPDAVVTWQKADAIAPLDDRSRFTLAMAYVKLHRQDGARKQLEKLAIGQPQKPLYLYWLARLDYDGQRYSDAITRLQRVTEIDPTMMRAYNLVGLCYDYQGRLHDAISAFSRAVALNRQDPHPSPWPNLDMANSQIELNQLPEAEKNLQEAIAYDPQLPKAQYDLGRVLEKQGRYRDAVQALKRAAALDSSYAEPHYLLGRIYQRLGETDLAKTEIEQFQNLGNTHGADKSPVK
jgi:tetratricopeptide (TPR) repeat protein